MRRKIIKMINRTSKTLWGKPNVKDLDIDKTRGMGKFFKNSFDQANGLSSI